MVNFGPGPATMPGGDILLASNPLDSGLLPVDTAVWLLTDRD